MKKTRSRKVGKRLTRRKATGRKQHGGAFSLFGKKKAPLTGVATANYKPTNMRVGTSLVNLANRRARFAINKSSQNWLKNEEEKYPHIQAFLDKQAEILDEIDADANPDEAAKALQLMAENLAADPNAGEVQEELDEAVPVPEERLDALLKMSPADAKSAWKDLRSGDIEGFKMKYPAMYGFLESSYNYLVPPPSSKRIQDGGGPNNNSTSSEYGVNYISFSAAFMMLSMDGSSDMGPLVVLLLFIVAIAVAAILAANVAIVGFKIVKYLVKLAIYDRKKQIVSGGLPVTMPVNTQSSVMVTSNPLASVHLPPGWEQVNQDGQTWYEHINGRTQWNRPML